jgi:NADPH:quinone reductase-like Zn-dependent oxidoreductase
LFKPRKQILGTDFAGEIVAAGSDVSLFNTGDKVFGFDDNGVCSHAEYMTLSEENAMALIPENINYTLAAASTEGAHYAINFINKVEINEGDKVLVNGATGAIGSAAVQLLKYHGAEVTAVCDGKYEDLLKSIGAGKIIDYKNKDFTKTAEKFKFVFDTVGKSTFAKCKPILEPFGIYISSELGPKIQNVFYSIFTPLTSKLPGKEGKIVRFPFPQNRLESVLLIKKLIEEKKFKPVVDKTYQLENTTDAFKYVENGEKIGNVVITLNSDV